MRVLISSIILLSGLAAFADESVPYDCFYSRCPFGRSCRVSDSIRRDRLPTLQISIDEKASAQILKPTRFRNFTLAYDGQYGVEIYASAFIIEGFASMYSGTVYLSAHRNTDAFIDWEDGRHLLLGYMVVSPAHETIEEHYVCSRH